MKLPQYFPGFAQNYPLVCWKLFRRRGQWIAYCRPRVLGAFFRDLCGNDV